MTLINVTLDTNEWKTLIDFVQRNLDLDTSDDLYVIMRELQHQTHFGFTNSPRIQYEQKRRNTNLGGNLSS